MAAADVRRALVALYPVMRQFAACTADRDLDPDELVQEAFARTVARWREGQGPDDLAAYVRRTIVNLVANERRTRGRARAWRRRQPVPSEGHEPAYPSHLAAVLDQVAPLDRALLFLVDVEGMSTGDAAGLVGLTGVAARSRLSRARRCLRAALDDPTDASDPEAVEPNDC